MTADISFGQWIRQRRKSLDLTCEDLSTRIGYTASTLYKIEADERRPSKQIAELLAEHLNIPPDERAAFIQFARAETVKTSASRGAPFHPSNNLQVQPTPLIGRDEDAVAIHKRLLKPELRLLTLIGPPGIGKTRLALHVAAQSLDDFADGVFFVALAPISDVNLVVTTISNALGLPNVGPQTALERLKVFLRNKEILLVLDNLEQILAAAPQIAELLGACLGLKLLVTSRSPLRIRPERQIPVSPLAVPDLAHLPDTETLSQYAAVTLFVERAQAVKPDFALTVDNAPTIAALCTRLDGLPLAIELISARVNLLSPSALLERLHGRLMLQSDGLRDLEPRHRTLNAAIEWSYQLLSAEEQALFRRLGVFVGGWTLDAAQAVCLEDLTLTILDGTASLLDKNLVKQDTRTDGEPRFLMLETIREYALEQLTDSGELDDLRQRHTDYFLDLAEGAEAHAFGHEQVAWFDQLEVEFDNLRAAFARSLDSETGLRLATALCWFFSERAHWNEGFIWLERTRLANPNAPVSLRAKALHTSGKLAGFLADFQHARMFCEQALMLARAANDRWNIAWSLSHLANHARKDANEGAALLEESLALFRELDDSMGITHTLVRLAWMAYDLEDYSYVRRLLAEALIRAQEAGDKICMAWASTYLGRISWLQDHDHMQTRTYLEAGYSLFREAHTFFLFPLIYMADVEQEMGNMARAQVIYKDILISLREKMSNSPDLRYVLPELARLASARGQLEHATRLLGATNSIMLDFGQDASGIPNFDRDVTVLREQLGATVFAGAWAVGEAMTSAQIIAYALEGNTIPTEPAIDSITAQPNQPLADPLNERELEILRLMADGCSNREIADRLFLALSTVKWYIRQMYSKLGVDSRTRALAHARELKLLP